MRSSARPEPLRRSTGRRGHEAPLPPRRLRTSSAPPRSTWNTARSPPRLRPLALSASELHVGHASRHTNAARPRAWRRCGVRGAPTHHASLGPRHVSRDAGSPFHFMEHERACTSPAQRRRRTPSLQFTHHLVPRGTRPTPHIRERSSPARRFATTHGGVGLLVTPRCQALVGR